MAKEPALSGANEQGLPTGIVTFLFTDIEGSTRLLEARPAAYRDELTRHDAIVRRAVAAHAGAIFQTRGDGFCAAFVSPVEAARAALDAQLALSDAESRVKVRMGLHTGEAELRGDEYFGAPLHRCARLMDSAHGGQVVLSAVTAALVGEVLPPGARLTDLGEHRLRDLVRPERVYQLDGAGLPAVFPPLRTLTATPNNLPIPSTEFVGREQPLQAVVATLLRPGTRLLTLTGPGGTGKTRLALQAASDLLDGFQDGVYFVPLASVTDPDLVLSTVAQALDVREAPGRPIVTALQEFMRHKHLLLILDNFEQVVAAAPAVAELLAAAPRLKVLVTSRAVLRLYGEHEFPVPPLALPDRRPVQSADHVTRFEAVRLFLSRAQAARPEFTIVDENAADVAEVCLRLDGLPLAIELAAARIRALPLRAMLQRMERRLPLLTGGPRDLPARQRTLRDTIAWSYDLLEPEEQVLFRRLSVFRGFTLESAETVCAGEPPRPGAASVALPPLGIDVLDGVESLVEKSLLRAEEPLGDEPRYGMLETVREFALERLEASGEDGAVRRRHVLAVVRLAETAEQAMVGPEETSWLVRLDREHDNVRAALRWCEAHGHAEPALRIAVALWWFWGVRGHVREGREHLSRVIERFPVKPTSARAGLYARTLIGAGNLASVQGDYAAARSLHERSLEIQRELDDPVNLLYALSGLGQIASLQRDFAVATQRLEEALALARDGGDGVAVGYVLHALGNVSYEQGDLTRARIYYQEGVALAQDGALYRGMLATTHAIALVAHEQGANEEARSLATEALFMYQQRGDRRLQALALATLGAIALTSGDLAGARAHLVASIALQHELGDVGAVTVVLRQFVELASMQGRWDGALRLAGSEASLREQSGYPLLSTDRARLDRAIDQARAALGDVAAEAAWNAGYGLPVGEAVAAALAVTETGLAGDEPTVKPASAGAANPLLSRREQEVVTLIARGLTNRQIAETLVITEGTAANHVAHILNKLGVNSRAQAAVWAAEQGLISPSSEQ